MKRLLYTWPSYKHNNNYINIANHWYEFLCATHPYCNHIVYLMRGNFQVM